MLKQILVENRHFCLPHLYSTPVRGSRQNIAIWFGMEKLEVDRPDAEQKVQLSQRDRAMFLVTKYVAKSLKMIPLVRFCC